jgi:hypothetical protein
MEKKYGELFEEGRMVYLSQIGVRKAYQGSSAADLLHAAFEESTHEGVVFAAVLRQPFSNPRSLNFFAGKGYTVVGELRAPAFKKWTNLVSDLIAKKVNP